MTGTLTTSQRLCVDPVLSIAEALALANKSVARHMKLIISISADRRIFHTYSLSEPVLALALRIYCIGMQITAIGKMFWKLLSRSWPRWIG